MMLFIGLAAQPRAEDQRTQRYNRQWVDYMQELAAAGALKSGSPLAPDGTTVTRESVSPLQLAEVDIGGYLLIEAESLDAAVAIASRAPHIALGGTTIIRRCISVVS